MYQVNIQLERTHKPEYPSKITSENKDASLSPHVVNILGTRDQYECHVVISCVEWKEIPTPLPDEVLDFRRYLQIPNEQYACAPPSILASYCQPLGSKSSTTRSGLCCHGASVLKCMVSVTMGHETLQSTSRSLLATIYVPSIFASIKGKNQVIFDMPKL